jgi:hypothetical protein
MFTPIRDPLGKRIDLYSQAKVDLLENVAIGQHCCIKASPGEDEAALSVALNLAGRQQLRPGR